MSAQMVGFPGCCTARVIWDLTGGLNDTTATLTGLIQGRIAVARNQGAKLVVAITTQQQIMGISALKACGFKHDPEVTNHDNVNHSDTRITLWSKELSE